MGSDISNIAIIVKMIRVMMLVPVLLVTSLLVSRAAIKQGTQGGSIKNIAIPWFAILFLVVIGFNSFGLLPKGLLSFINNSDTFLLTMAMTALGAETSIDKFKKAGLKPFILASLLYVWLIVGGYNLVKYLVPVLM
jgi:uncharacterized integral membrane protein (TIGR00698 family)